jgi:superfamily II DNA or RNA helicase
VKLRQYQLDVTDRARDAVRHGVKRLLIQAATGSGKTVLVASLILSAVQKGKRVLVLAHRKELIDQMFKTLVSCGLTPGVIMGDDYRARYDAMVQVASVQTLARRDKPPADVIVIDEAHRANAKSYRDIVAAYPDAVLIGLSATPERTDGQGLCDMFDDMICAPSIAELTEMGYLLPLKVYAPAQPDLKGLPRSGGDYNQKALGERLRGDVTRVGEIPRHWELFGERRRTIYFGANVEDSRNMASEFVARGIAAEHLDGDTNTSLRDAVLGRLASGETLIVCQCDLLVEGYDLPSLGCVILGRPTLSIIRYLQQIGRVMRPWEDQTYAIVLDHAGCVHRHGLPATPRQWSLEGRKERDGKPEESGSKVLTCETCSTVRPANVWRCPTCFGVQEQIFVRAPIEVDGELVEFKPRDMAPVLCTCGSDSVTLEPFNDLRIRVKCRACGQTTYQPDRVAARMASADRKAAELARLEGVREQKSFKPGWVTQQYRETFGELPPRKPSAPSNGNGDRTPP